MWLRKCLVRNFSNFLGSRAGVPVSPFAYHALIPGERFVNAPYRAKVLYLVSIPVKLFVE